MRTTTATKIISSSPTPPPPRPPSPSSGNLYTMELPISLDESMPTRDKLLKLAEISPNKSGGGLSNGNTNGKKKLTVKSLKNKSSVNSKQNNASLDLSFTSNVEHLVARDQFRSSTPINHNHNNSNSVSPTECASHPPSRNGSPTKSTQSVTDMYCPDDSPPPPVVLGHQHTSPPSHKAPQLHQQQPAQFYSTSLTESQFRSLRNNNSPSDLMFSSMKISDQPLYQQHPQQHHPQHQQQQQSLSASKVQNSSRIPHLRGSSQNPGPGLSSNSRRAMGDFGQLNRWPETEDLSKHQSNRRLFVDDLDVYDYRGSHFGFVANPHPTLPCTNQHFEHESHQFTAYTNNQTPAHCQTNLNDTRIPQLATNPHKSRIHKSLSAHQHITNCSSPRTNLPTGIQRNDITSTASIISGHIFEHSKHPPPQARLLKSKTNDSFVATATAATAAHQQMLYARAQQQQQQQHPTTHQFDFSSPTTAARVFEKNEFDPSWFPVISNSTSTITATTNVSALSLADDCARRNSILTPTNRPTHLSGASAASLGIYTPDQSLYEKFFFRESQKNLIAAITDQKLARSASCESFELFQQQTLTETKFATDNTNQLNGLMHLEEEPREEDSILNRFRKSFSLRFSRSKVDETEGGEQASSRAESRDGDINQNTIFHIDQRPHESHFNRVSTIERRKSRNHDPFARKSLRRTSRKSYRLKRSSSQPTDKILDDTRSPTSTDLSFDSSDVESCKSPTLNETRSTTDLNDSHEKHEDVIYAEAIWDYLKSDAEELSFKAGDLIDVSDTSNKEWWWGAVTNKDGETHYGWFPATYVRLKVSQEDTIEEVLAKSVHEDEDALKRMSMSKISSEQVRSNIVLEIINSEREFVKNLGDVIDGYLKPCRDREEMFSAQQIQTIFGNIEQLHQFATRFLSELEKCVNWESLSSSEIGNCFWNNEKAFGVYGDFCKNHPLAMSELQDLYLDHRYIVFFEGCRLLQNMIDISLDGFLLTPVQKICKYPLQLAELLKHTRADHPDHEPIKKAFEAMQRVAQLINDRKSRFESLEKLIALQEQFENWEGLPLIDSCSLLIHSGEVTRITSGAWSKDIQLMLFDHLLILCKKESGILKKGAYIFKSRIEMDEVDEFIALDDNIKDTHFNITTKNAFKFFYKPLQKWYLFQSKTPAEKAKWVEAFGDERKRVQDDKEQGFTVSEQDKRGALISRQNNLKPRKPRSSRTSRPTTKSKKPDTVIAEIPLGPMLDRNRAGSLPSYIHHEVNAAYKRQSTMQKKSRSNWFQLGSSKKKPGSRLKRNVKAPSDKIGSR